MSTLLGTTSDGRTLTYDAALYEFSLDGELTSFADLRTFDDRNWIKWRASQLRDWFRQIVPEDLDACNRRARSMVSVPMVSVDAQPLDKLDDGQTATAACSCGAYTATVRLDCPDGAQQAASGEIVVTLTIKQEGREAGSCSWECA